MPLSPHASSFTLNNKKNFSAPRRGKLYLTLSLGSYVFFLSFFARDGRRREARSAARWARGVECDERAIERAFEGTGEERPARWAGLFDGA